MAEKSYIDFRNNLETLQVGQDVEIIVKTNDFFIGKVTELDLEAKGFWLLLERTSIEDEDIDHDWYFSNQTFFYVVDIISLKVLSKGM